MSDRLRVLPDTWRPAAWSGDDPVTPWGRLTSFLDLRSPGWRGIGWDWALLVILVAVLTRLFEGAR